MGGCGGRVALYEGDMSHILPHIQSVSPTVFAAVPRFWNRLYSAYQTECQARRALSSSEGPEGEEKGTNSSVDEQVLNEFSQCLGHRLYQVITGGAPTSSEVLTFLKDCFARRGATISNGYG